MIRQIKLIMAVLLLVALARLTLAAPALAAGLSVQPSSGGYGKTFVLNGTGFNAGESVSIAVTAPNGSTVGSATLTADSGGAIQYSATVPSSAPVGKYTIVALGKKSGGKYSASFTVTASPSSTSKSTTSTSTSAAGMSVTPTSGGADTSLVLTAGGFNAGETVSIWIVNPSGTTVSSGTLTADSSGAIEYSGKVPTNATAGKYTIIAQGRSSGRQYSTTFTVTSSSSSYPDWKGEYFNNQSLSGSPVLVRNDTSINFNWGLGSPDSSVSGDHFSVRWTRNQYFDAGTYTFTATTDDGMRVWVGDTLLIDTWYDQSATHTATITLAAGTYALKVEYYEDTGYAVAQVSWATTSSTEQPWTGYYYNNTSLSGTPVLIRQDAQLNFDWGSGSPSSVVSADNFSAKWDSSQYASYSGYYTVYVTADDGVRVWVDGNLVIDEWHDASSPTYSATGYLNAGWHSVHVEYYEHTGTARLQVAFVGD